MNAKFFEFLDIFREVAQISNLLYRRVGLCGACAHSDAVNLSNALPTASRRYSRLEICATTRRFALGYSAAALAVLCCLGARAALYQNPFSSGFANSGNIPDGSAAGW